MGTRTVHHCTFDKPKPQHDSAKKFEAAMLRLENLTPHQEDIYRIIQSEPRVDLRAPAGERGSGFRSGSGPGIRVRARAMADAMRRAGKERAEVKTSPTVV